jgi:phosphatidylglycerol---prolipoprotein diacylglyceryl transferase
MYPILFNKIPSYGILLFIGVIISLFIFRRGLRKHNLDLELYTDIIIGIFLISFMGARILHVLVEYNKYLTSIDGFINIFKLWDGGYVYFGGIIFGLILMWIYRKRFNYKIFGDEIVIPLLFSHFMGRMGCFFAGCCWGKHNHLGFVKFPSQSVAYQYYESIHKTSYLAGSTTIPLHPTQLYEGFFNLCLIIFFLIMGSKKRFTGHFVALYLIMYGIFRFLLEIFRGDDNRGTIFRINSPGLNKILNLPEKSLSFLTISQFISILMISLGILIFYLNRDFSNSDAA